MKKTKAFSICGVAAVLLAAASVPVMGSVLYTQATNFATPDASQNDTNGGGLGNFATTYDNFTLGTDSDITSVQWVGSYFNPSTQGTITAFTVAFYSDNSGAPGTLIQSFNVAGSNGEFSLGNDAQSDPAFAYSMNVDFDTTGGTQYWLSIVPDLGFPPQWGWESGTGGDGLAYQVYYGAGSGVANDMAFQLNGSSAPEPFSFGLMGAGLLALGLAKLRRNRA
jgi:hypothetical protein